MKNDCYEKFIRVEGFNYNWVKGGNFTGGKQPFFFAISPYYIEPCLLACERFRAANNPDEKETFELFCSRSGFWLDDYSLFMALKKYHRGKSWQEWKPEIKLRDPAVLRTMREKLTAFHCTILFASIISGALKAVFQ